MEDKLSKLVEQAVDQGILPQFLYKYREINEYFEDALINGRLWFSKPDMFNDPFDCQITVDTNNTKEEIEAFIKRNIKGLPRNELRLRVRNTYNNPEKWNNMVNRIFKDDLSKKGVCCFCVEHQNILLWSYYSGSHKGVCLKFDINQDPAFFLIPLKVNYQKEYPYYNHLKDESKLAKILIGTKSEFWAHEQEVRVVKAKSGLHQFKKEALTEIIFGCKCPNEEVKRIKKLAKDNGYENTTFKKATVKKYEYGLDFVNV